MASNRLAIGIAAVFWLCLVGAGSVVLLDYGLTAGVAGVAPVRWPQNSGLTLHRHQATLVMAVHPHCPCSRASLAELSELMAADLGKVKAYVLFVRPPGVGQGWERTDLWRQAAAITGATVVSDDSGREATRFGAVTSGQTMLYDQSGTLRFSGGITAARGYYGDNAGRRAIVALLHSSRPGSPRTPFYGCPLMGHASGPRKVVACKH